MTEPENEILSLAQVLARLKGSIGRKNLIAHIKSVPHFSGGPTYRRNGTKYFFTAADFSRLLDSFAAVPDTPQPKSMKRRIANPTLPSEERLFQSLVRRLNGDGPRRKSPKRS